MAILIIGGGIGGLATALRLHAAGLDVEVFEQAAEMRELGVGINTLPHAIKDLAELGLLPALDEVGIRTSLLTYANRFGQTVWQEPRGLAAGLETPQFSIHRGKLHGVLHRAALDRLGAGRLHTSCRLLGFTQDDSGVTARFAGFEVRGEALIGADGIHSTVRAQLYPQEGPPVWAGIMLWRGATEWPVYLDGASMVIAGGMHAKFVFYPIYADPSRPGTRLTNWAVQARVAPPGSTLPRREDWNREGRMDDLRPIVEGGFQLGFVDPMAIIRASQPFYEFPMCDRDPLPAWSFGRVTLLGDAAHPMYPVGSNGASQAVLDASALARHLLASPDIATAFAAYDSERRQITADRSAGGARPRWVHGCRYRHDPCGA